MEKMESDSRVGNGLAGGVGIAVAGRRRVVERETGGEEKRADTGVVVGGRRWREAEG